MSDDILYINVDDEGNPTGPKVKEKWRQPDNDLHKRFLAAAWYKHWPERSRGGKDLRHEFIRIERAMMPLSSTLISEYPTEWVEAMISWASKTNRMVRKVDLPGILNAINNADKKEEFIRIWAKKHPDITLRRLSKEEEETAVTHTRTPPVVAITYSAKLFDEDI